MFGEALSRYRESRPSASRAGFGSTSLLRGEVKPPSLRCEPAEGWQRLKYWFFAPAPLDASPPLNTLPAVRADFLACLSGVDGTGIPDLKRRIEQARSLRELWHLRTSLFGQLACHLSQSEAQTRLESLNAHFGGRAARSTFHPLQP